jgi:hypothetical protein
VNSANPSNASELDLKLVGERRWPMALAVLSAGSLFFAIPEEFRLPNIWHYLYLVFIIALLLVLTIGDPGRINRENRWLRIVTGIMLGMITAATAISAVRLITGIITQAVFDTPGKLLLIGAIVWITNVTSFALWYWHLDSGGPAVRARRDIRTQPAFHFPEQSLPSIVGANWYPQFIDYLALSFNVATSFSPTDIAAIRHWSKLSMIAESAISLALVGLVLARAVNVL